MLILLWMLNFTLDLLLDKTYQFVSLHPVAPERNVVGAFKAKFCLLFDDRVFAGAGDINFVELCLALGSTIYY